LRLVAKAAAGLQLTWHAHAFANDVLLLDGHNPVHNSKVQATAVSRKLDWANLSAEALKL
jgi:hypothetical protein